MLTEATSIAIFPAGPLNLEADRLWSLLIPETPFQQIVQRPTEGGKRVSGPVEGYECSILVQPIRMEISLTAPPRSTERPDERPRVGDDSPDAMLRILSSIASRVESLSMEGWQRMGLIVNSTATLKASADAIALLRGNVPWLAALPDGLLDIGLQFNERTEERLESNRIELNRIRRFGVEQQQWFFMDAATGRPPQMHTSHLLRLVQDINNVPQEEKLPLELASLLNVLRSQLIEIQEAD